MKTRIMKSAKGINTAVKALRKGGIVVYPTETSYGIGADFLNKKAVAKIYRIKRRSRIKKMPVIVADIKMAKKFIGISKKTELLMKKFMPGPLTLVDNNTAFRISGNSSARLLTKKLDRPITSTSANVSGKKPIFKINDIIREFDGKVDLIVNAENLKKRKLSTIYDVGNDKIIRKGLIIKKDIVRAFKN